MLRKNLDPPFQGRGSWLFFAFCTVVGTIIGLIVGGILRVLYLFGKSLLQVICENLPYKFGRKAQASATGQIVEPTGETDQAQPVQQNTLAEPDLSLRDFDNATHKRVTVGKTSVVDIWFYPDIAVARRTLRPGTSGQKQKLGQRVKMDDLPMAGITRLEVERTTIAEAETLLAAVRKKEAPEKATQKAVISARIPPSVPDNTVSEVQQKTPDRPPPAKPADKTIDVQQPKTKEATYRGILRHFGVEEHRDHGNNGFYKCFCVDLEDFGTGSINRVIGTDLERAVAAVGAKAGDNVEVSLNGEIKTPKGGGKYRTKKLWTVIKL